MSEHANVDGVYPFPAVMQTRTIETNGTSIHVRVGGHGPAVVMLHADSLRLERPSAVATTVGSSDT